MNLLKQIFLTIFQWAKQACLLPQAYAKAVKQKQQRAAVNEREAERVDRIRHPENYRGK